MNFTIEELNNAKSKALIYLMARPDTTFFTTIVFSLTYKWDETIPTACTNGTWVKLNPQFFMNMTMEEQAFLMVHEACHVAYMHADRLHTRDHSKFNIAADHVINLMLIERGMKMPKSGLADRQYTGMSAEEVYNLLPPPPEDFDSDLEPSDVPTEELQQQVDDILMRAAIQSQMDNDKPGTIPGEIQIYLDNLLKPKLPWKTILSRYIKALSKNDYTYRKPNRRFFPEYYLPSLYSEKLINIAVAVDTSGSVTDEEFKRFVSEVHGILRMMKPESLTFIQFDTVIHSVTPIRNVVDLMNTTFHGRGGTCVEDLLNWAEKNKPQLLLVFTDGHFRFQRSEDSANLVWLIHSNPKFVAPFGKTIHYTV
jgi:predicted metal-dependent peptidase